VSWADDSASAFFFALLYESLFSIVKIMLNCKLKINLWQMM